MGALSQRWLCAFVIAMLVSGGCSSSSDNVSASLNAPLLLADIAKALQIQNTTLSIDVYVDDATTPSRVVDNVVVSDDDRTVGNFLVELPIGEHRLRLEYVIVHPEWGRIVVARTNAITVALTPTTTSVDFSAATIALPLPDNDGDGESNLAELRADTHPGQSPEPVPGPSEYLLRARVSGLKGTLVLTSADQTLTATVDGVHAFPLPLADGTAFNVTIQRQPVNQACTIGPGTAGTISGQSILIDISCDVPLYSVAVMVSGLQGSGLVLQNNFSDDLAIAGNGQASFATKLASGRPYGVSVGTQPTLPGGDPIERCIVVQSTGIIAIEDVVVAVECSIPPAPHYTIGGTVAGLKGRLVLRNDRDDLIVVSNGDFQFALPLTRGKNFDVSVAQQPSAQQCGVTGGSGQVDSADVRSVTVVCSDALVLEATPLSKEVELAWNQDDSALYDVYVATVADCDWDNYTTCPGDQLITNVVRSPFRVTGLVNNQIYYFRLVARYGSGASIVSKLARAQPGSLQSNGAVKDIAVAVDGTVYLAGEFTSLAVPHGGGAVLDAATGRRDFAFSIDGGVYAAVADGQGGWYVGGRFKRVNGVARQNLAHLLADDSLDPAFDIAIGDADANVEALLLHNGHLYVGGTFTTVGGQTRKNLAAIDLTTGAVTAWAPDPDQVVVAFAAQADRIYVGGNFTTLSGNNVTGAERRAVAAFDLAGNLLDWSHTFEHTFTSSRHTIKAFAMDGSGRLWVGGWFGKVDGRGCETLVAFLPDGRLDPNWQCSTGSNNARGVEALVLTGNTLYAGGWDSAVYTGVYPRMLAVDAATGATIGSLPTPEVQGVTALAYDGSQLIVGGLSRTAGAMMALELNSSAQTVWQQMLPGNIRVLASTGGRLFAGGEITAWRGREIPRGHAAALSSDGRLLSWSPNTNQTVDRLAVTGTAVYLMGSFSTAQGTNGTAIERNGLAAFDTAGTLLDWNPGASGQIPSAQIHALLHANGALYVGGGFTEFAGQECKYAATVAADGTAQCWPNEPDGPVRALEADDAGNVFVGGKFTQLGASPGLNLAAVDSAGNVRADWKVDASDWVTALARSGTTLYVGGGFETLNALPRPHLAAVSTTDGAVYAFSQPINVGISTADQLVHRMRVVGPHVIVAGNFSHIGGLARNGLLALSGSDLGLRDWNPAPAGLQEDDVLTIAANPLTTRLYVGGRFTHIEAHFQPYFAELAPP